MNYNSRKIKNNPTSLIGDSNNYNCCYLMVPQVIWWLNSTENFSLLIFKDLDKAWYTTLFYITANSFNANNIKKIEFYSKCHFYYPFECTIYTTNQKIVNIKRLNGKYLYFSSFDWRRRWSYHPGACSYSVPIILYTDQSTTTVSLEEQIRVGISSHTTR